VPSPRACKGDNVFSFSSMRERVETAVVSFHAGQENPAATNPGITPNQTGLPGLSVVREFVGALTFWGLIACVAGLAVSGGALAFAKVTNRGGMADQSKTGALWAAIGAVILGGSNAIIAFFANAGTGI